MQFSALQYKGGFDDWEVAVAKNVVHGFLSQWKCLQPEDFYDLTQEALLHWLQNRHKYRAGLNCNERTFMARVVKNRLCDMLKAMLSKKRRPEFGEAISIYSEAVPGSDEGEAITFEEVIADPRDNTWLELKLDLCAVTSKLSKRQQLLCQMLASDMSMLEISKRLDVPRATLYDDLARIKKIFEANEIAGYAK